MLFLRLAWAVKELERSSLAYLSDSHLPTGKRAVFDLSICEKSGGRVVFSSGVA